MSIRSSPDSQVVVDAMSIYRRARLRWVHGGTSGRGTWTCGAGKLHQQEESHSPLEAGEQSSYAVGKCTMQITDVGDYKEDVL